MSFSGWLRRAAGGASASSHVNAGRTGHDYSDDFLAFVRETRGVDAGHAQRLIDEAQAQFNGGWAGTEYRAFTERALMTLRPLYDDATAQARVATYQAHAPFDFLRMLSYRVPAPAEFADITDLLATRSSVTLVDYGCGLAHRSVAIGKALVARGVAVKLMLVDIARPLHVTFLDFLCRRHGLSHEFVDVGSSAALPVLAPHDYCDVVNVFEHVSDPVAVFDSIDRALRPCGLVLASVADQAHEMMHVSPDLADVRQRLTAQRYRKRREWLDATLFEKSADRA